MYDINSKSLQWVYKLFKYIIDIITLKINYKALQWRLEPHIFKDIKKEALLASKRGVYLIMNDF